MRIDYSSHVVWTIMYSMFQLQIGSLGVLQDEDLYDIMHHAMRTEISTRTIYKNTLHGMKMILPEMAYS